MCRIASNSESTQRAVNLAADVIKRSRQLILVLCVCVTSFTATTLIEDERHTTLRDAIIRLCVQMRPLDGPPTVVRTDPAPGFKALSDDQLLKHHRITIDVGHAKNQNKNPSGRESGPRARKRVTPTCFPRRPCVPFDTSSSHLQPQRRTHPITWPFLQRDVDTARSILQPSNTTT